MTVTFDKAVTLKKCMFSIIVLLIIMTSAPLEAKSVTNKKIKKKSHKKAKAKKRSVLGPLLDAAWGMTGKEGINILKAWKSDKKVFKKCRRSTTIVAVVDTGLDFNHPDIKNAIWINHAEANGKPGVDDDKNGFIDDINGWNFVNNKPLKTDNHGHGTHIAGIIAADSPNKLGYRGVCPGIKIMPLKYFDLKAKNNDTLGNTVKAFDYAIKMNAKIINYSGGGNYFSQPEKAALARAQKAGVLVIAAAGNDYKDNDQTPYYPSSYELDNIISVASISKKGKLLDSSNWGMKKVDVAAPGGLIHSLAPGGNYKVQTGTSQATAFVTGIAALVWSQNTRLGYKKVKNILLRSVKKKKEFKKKVASSGVIDASLAMKHVSSLNKRMHRRSNKKVITRKKKLKNYMSPRKISSK